MSASLYEGNTGSGVRSRNFLETEYSSGRKSYCVSETCCRGELILDGTSLLPAAKSPSCGFTVERLFEVGLGFGRCAALTVPARGFDGATIRRNTHSPNRVWRAFGIALGYIFPVYTVYDGTIFGSGGSFFVSTNGVIFAMGRRLSSL